MVMLAGIFVAVHSLGVAWIAVAAGKTVILHVDDGAAPGGTGSGRAPFNNLPDAAAARILGPGVVLNVEPGNYPLVSPLVIDFPLVMRGSTEQVVDVNDPWPTGSVVPGTQTRVFAAAPMSAQALVYVGRTDSSVISGVTIRGFVFEGGTPTTFQVQMTRVQGYIVADNVFRAPTMLPPSNRPRHLVSSPRTISVASRPVRSSPAGIPSHPRPSLRPVIEWSTTTSVASY